MTKGTGGNVMRRVAAIASVLLTACTVAMAGVEAANAAPDTGPTAGAAAAGTGSNETPGVTCSVEYTFQNSYGGGNGQYFWNATSSPYTLYAKSATPTGYCRQPVSGGGNHLIQYGTSRCLTVDTSTRTVTGGNCNSSAAAINLIAVGTDTAEVQFLDVTKACIYQNGRNSPVTYNPCQPGQTGDVWIEHLIER
jgi:hypothetical protein